MISCILLSAGLSQRFGSPKALALFQKTRVIEHLQTTLLKSLCDEIIIVLGAHALEIQPFLSKDKRIRTITNKNYILGQTSSIQEGCRDIHPHTQGILILPIDCPCVQTSTLDILIDYFKKHNTDVLIPAYQNKKGHPPLMHQRLKSQILALDTSTGINIVFKEHAPKILNIEDKGIIQSFNTPLELENIQKDLLPNNSPSGIGRADISVR